MKLLNEGLDHDWVARGPGCGRLVTAPSTPVARLVGTCSALVQRRNMTKNHARVLRRDPPLKDDTAEARHGGQVAAYVTGRSWPGSRRPTYYPRDLLPKRANVTRQRECTRRPCACCVAAGGKLAGLPFR
jgi:hypothetical protein